MRSLREVRSARIWSLRQRGQGSAQLRSKRLRLKDRGSECSSEHIVHQLLSQWPRLGSKVGESGLDSSNPDAGEEGPM